MSAVARGERRGQRQMRTERSERSEKIEMTREQREEKKGKHLCWHGVRQCEYVLTCNDNGEFVGRREQGHCYGGGSGTSDSWIVQKNCASSVCLCTYFFEFGDCTHAHVY